MQRVRRQEGFTLAELLIVVAVVGILLAVAIPVYASFTKKASDTAGAANAHEASVTSAATSALGADAAPSSAAPMTPAPVARQARQGRVPAGARGRGRGPRSRWLTPTQPTSRSAR